MFQFAEAKTYKPELSGDTTLLKFANQGVKITNDPTPTIVRQGDVLTIDVGPTENPVQVRIHSSLGRLVKYFSDVVKPVSMSTKALHPGVYLVIIKKETEREIRKVLVTEP
ncbi:MAG: hypothetical protein OHK0053_24930 [Microscillaceae bacterium]